MKGWANGQHGRDVHMCQGRPVTRHWTLCSQSERAGEEWGYLACTFIRPRRNSLDRDFADNFCKGGGEAFVGSRLAVIFPAHVPYPKSLQPLRGLTNIQYHDGFPGNGISRRETHLRRSERDRKRTSSKSAPSRLPATPRATAVRAVGVKSGLHRTGVLYARNAVYRFLCTAVCARGGWGGGIFGGRWRLPRHMICFRLSTLRPPK